MTFAEWSKKKLEEEKKQGKKSSVTSTDSSFDTDIPVGDLSFAEWSRKKLERESITGWTNSATSLATEVHDRYKKWDADEETYNNYSDRTTELLAAASNWRNKYSDNKEITSHIDEVVSVLENIDKYASTYYNNYSKFGSEAEYNDAVKLNELYSMPSSDLYVNTWDERRRLNLSVLTHDKSKLEASLSDKSKSDEEIAEIKSQIADLDKKIANAEAIVKNGDIAYTTSSGQNITWKSLYDQKKAEEDFENLYTSITGSKDFNESIKNAKSFKNPSPDDIDPDKDIYNKVTILDDDYKGVPLGSFLFMAEVNGYKNSLGINIHTVYLTKEEKDIYNYYFGRGEYDKADEYLNSLKETLRKRFEGKEVEGMKKIAEELPITASAISVGTSLGSGVEYLVDSIKYLGTGELDDNQAANLTTAIRGTVSENVDWEIGNWDAFDFVYNSGMSMADSVAAMATMGNFGGIALGLSAAAQGTNDALNRGMSNSDAFWTGFSSGVFEGLFETVSIGQFSVLKEIPESTVKGIAKNIGKSMLVNASEETLTELANIAYDKFVNGDFSQMETSIRAYMAAGMSEEEARSKVTGELVGQVAEAGASGALMGFVMGGGGQAIGYVNNRVATGQNIIDNKGYDDLKALALDVSAEASGIKGIDNAVAKADKKTSAWNVGGLSQKVDSVRGKQNVADVKAALIEKGYSEKDATKTAQKIIEIAEKKASGVDITQAEYNAVTKDSATYEVYSSLVSNPDSSVNTRNKKHIDARNGITENEDGTVELSEAQQERRTKAVAQMVATAQIASESRFGANTGIAEKDADGVEIVTPEDAAAYKGKTTYMNPETGETKVVKVQGISSIKDGEMMLKLDNGETVNASDVRFSSEGEALVYSTMVDMGVNAGVAEALVNEFKSSGVNAGTYALGIRDAYEFGTMNAPLSQLSKNSFARNLSDAQREYVYKLGQTEAKANTDADQKAINKDVKKAKGKASVKAGKIIVEDAAIEVDESGNIDESKLNGTQKANLVGIKALAELSPINFHIFKSDKVNGKFVATINGEVVENAPNGVYMAGTNDIWIDINAGDMGEGTMLWTAAHEISHYIRERSPAKWKAMADFLVAEYSKNKDISITDMLETQEAKVKAREDAGKKSETEIADEAYEEFVADALSEMLTDGNVVNFLAELKQKNKSVWQTIKDAVADLLKRWGEVLGAYKDRDATTAEAQALRGMEKAYKKLQKMYAEAFAEANAVEEAQAYLKENGIEVISDGKQEVASLNSVRNLLDNGQQQKVAKALADRLDVTEAEAMEWIKAETSLASLILNPKYSQYLDYEADASEEAIKKNSDYPQGTVDFSNNCPKRRAFTEVMNRVLRNFPNHVFMATDLAKIRTIMEEEGLDVACAICYVEDRRQLDSIVAKDFIDSLELYRNGSKTRPDGKPFNANQLKAFSLIESDTYTPSIYELVSVEGRTELKAKNSAMEEAWVKFNNARGMQSVRLLLNEAEYKRQILKYNEKTVQSKNDLGGLRIYSFSDMEMFHLIDIIQVITDSASVGLMLQGYTKVNEYAKAVKDTGEKLNRSLIPLGELGYHMEGNKVVLDFDTVEGIDINHPDFFDNSDNPNVGNIVIGINNRQIRAAMVSEFIDQIIPFHTGQSAEVLGEKGIGTWDNYKDYQSEKDISTGKKSEHQINIYTEVIQAAEKEGKPIKNKVDFVNKFLEVCKENGLEPRFSQFLNTNENGDYVYTEGYHKFLVDFKTFDQKTGEYLPQMPVKPIFDDKYMTGLLKNYAKSQAQKDADTAKAMPKVIERITNEVVKPEMKFSQRGVAKDGKKIYESNFPKGTPKSAKSQRILDYIQNVWSKKPISLVISNGETSRTILAQFDPTVDESQNTPTDASKLAGGNRHGNHTEQRVTLDLADDYYQIASEARYNYSKLETGKDLETHDGVKMWHYFVNEIYFAEYGEEEYTPYTVTINVKEKEDGDFVYSFNAEKESSTRQTLHAAVNTRKGANGELFIDDIISQDDDGVKKKFSERNKAPTFYSHMGKVVDDIKTEKVGAGGVVPYLKGKGVKNEEIKWSGIEAFLEGKKSVTKAELQEFIAGSMLQIEEQMSGADIDLRYNSSNHSYSLYDKDGNIVDTFTYNDFVGGYVSDTTDEIYSNAVELEDAVRDEYGSMSSPRWADYKLDGGSNYREIVFTLPNSTYTNRAMKGHWGQDAEGILVHARIQDFDVNGQKMLFVEELQSDWHNEGHSKGYSTEEYEAAATTRDKLYDKYKKLDLAFHKYVRSNDFMSDLEDVRKKKSDWLRGKVETAQKKYLDAERDVEALKKKGMGDVADAPFKDTYHEYVMKRLIRMAAEEGYDSIGWTPAEIQVKRWSEEYAEGYRIEYDQDIPKFMGKFGKKWGAKVGKTVLGAHEEQFDVDAETNLNDDSWLLADGIKFDGTEVWSMPITDAMKQSVLYEGQALYQERNTDSNRSLLANALETTVQNDIEAQKLKQYKEKIALIDAEQQKLAEINAEIRELSFSKGKRDEARLKSLRFDAVQAANRINTYDRQLLNLESTKVLKAVLDREKGLAMKRQKQKNAEALKQYREKVEVEKQKIREKNAESRKKAADRRKASAIKEKIKNFKVRLEKSLLSPTDRVYVPINLINAMVDVCDLIDTDTDLYKADGSINKAQERRNLTKERLQALKDEYEALKDHNDPTYSGEYDEVIYKYLTKLLNDYGNKSLVDMSLEELTDMYETLKSIEGTLQDARKLIGRADAKDIYETADSIIAEQANITTKRKKGKRNAVQKAKDNVINLSLSPVRNVERMSGYNQDSELVRLFNEFEKGVRKKNLFVMKAYKAFEALTTGKNAKLYDDAIYKEYGNKKYVDVNGRKFGISKMQMMQAILSYEREQANNMHHIEGSGFAFADMDMLRKGKLSEAVSEEYSHRLPSAIDMVENFKLELANDKWAQDYMQAARQFFNGTAKDAINETYLTLKHRILARDKSYIPFEVDKNFVVREISAQNDIQQTINSYGMLQETKQGASQPLIITGLNNILDRHIDQVGNVQGLAIPVRNFNKVWNVRSIESGNGDPTVQAAIQRNWGLGGTKHITQTVQDIQGARVNTQSDIYKKVKSGYIGATFMLNFSVVTKQIGSLYSATSMLKWRDPFRMMSNLLYTMVNSKKIATEVDKYTATAWMRRQGLSDAEVYTLVTEAKKPGVSKFFSKVNPSKLITAMDHAVALSLWKYAKQDVAKKTGLKGEELLEATAEFYDSVVENTQSMTDVLHRPEIQKRNDVVSEAFGMFKTDLYQMAGQLEVTLGRYTVNKNAENGKALGKTAYAILTSAMWGQLMTTLFALIRYKVKPYRDDEDDDLTLEAWLERIGFSLLGDLMGYLIPLFGSEVVGFFEHIKYGESEDIVDSLALTAINDLYDAMITVGSAVIDGEMPTAAQYKKLVTKSLQVFGIPANNIVRIVEAIDLHAKDIANGEFLSFEAGADRSAAQSGNGLYKAIISGDEKDIDRFMDDFEDEDAAQNALVKAIRENDEDVIDTASAYINQDLRAYDDTIDKLVSQGFEEETASKAIRSVVSMVESAAQYKADGDTEAYNEKVAQLLNLGYDEDQLMKDIVFLDKSPSDSSDKAKSPWKNEDYITAIENGDTAMAETIKEDLINTMVENGKTEDEAEESLSDALYTHYKNKFIEGNLSNSEAETRIREKNPDYTDADVYWELKKWKALAEHKDDPDYSYSKYGEFYEAILSGDQRSMNAFIQECRSHTNRTSNKEVAGDISSAIRSHFKPIYIEASASERVVLKRKLLAAYTSLGYAYSSKSKDIDKWLEDN